MLAVAIVVYVTVALAVLRPIAGHLAWSFARDNQRRWPTLYREGVPPNGDQWFGAYIGALLAVAVWPVIAVVLIGGGMLPKVGSEREALMKRKDDEIRRLERELDLERR